MGSENRPTLTISPSVDSMGPGSTITFHDGRVAEIVAVEGSVWTYRFLPWYERWWRWLRSIFDGGANDAT